MKARILIAEDECIVQLDLQRRLERMGHTVVGMVARGDQAVAGAVELKPDLVLMDVRLGGSMDGIEAARRIRAGQGTPVVYLTAYAGLLTGVDGETILGPCVSKPFATVELASTIAKVLTKPVDAGRLLKAEANSEFQPTIDQV